MPSPLDGLWGAGFVFFLGNWLLLLLLFKLIYITYYFFWFGRWNLVASYKFSVFFEVTIAAYVFPLTTLLSNIRLLMPNFLF
jgi:hypothetical protein